MVRWISAAGHRVNVHWAWSMLMPIAATEGARSCGCDGRLTTFAEIHSSGAAKNLGMTARHGALQVKFSLAELLSSNCVASQRVQLSK